MIEQWQELKETITEMRDNDGKGTQQEVCKFLVNYMNVLEKQMQEPTEWQQDHEILKAYSDGANEMRDKIQAEIKELSHYYPMGHDYQIAITRCLAVIDKYKADPQESEEV